MKFNLFISLFFVAFNLSAQDPGDDYFKPVSRYTTHHINAQKVFSFGATYAPGNQWVKTAYYLRSDIAKVRVTPNSAVLFTLSTPFGFKRQVNKLKNDGFAAPKKEIVNYTYFAPAFTVGYSYGFAIPCFISVRGGVYRAWEKANYKLLDDSNNPIIQYRQTNNSIFAPVFEAELYGNFNIKNEIKPKFGWSISATYMPSYNGLTYNAGFYWAGL